MRQNERVYILTTWEPGKFLNRSAVEVAQDLNRLVAKAPEEYQHAVQIEAESNAINGDVLRVYYDRAGPAMPVSGDRTDGGE